MNFKEFKDKYQKIPVQEFPNQVPDNLTVSVYIQTYQHAPYIRECLDGILMQETDFPFEILLGEDDSTDGTREICIEYAEKYPDKIRLFLHHRENNISILGKPTGRFNVLNNIFNAKGKYLAPCPGDDYWTDPKKLQKQFDFMDTHPSYSMCGHDAFIIGETGIMKVSKLPESQKKDFTSNEAQHGIYVLMLTAFFKKIDDIPEESLRIINFDTFLFIYLGLFGHYKYINSISPAGYRIHPGGIWSASGQNMRELADLSTQFWISKYYERQNKIDLKSHFGINVTRKSLMYLVEPTWRNYLLVAKHMLYIKFPKLSSLLIRYIGFFSKR